MAFHSREAAPAASPLNASVVRKVDRGRLSPRAATALCALALLAASASWVLNSPVYEEWRLSRMDLAALQRGLKPRMNDPLPLYYIGLRLNQQRRFAEADGYLRQAVGLDPDSARLRDEWAQALLGSGQTTAAFGELSEFAGTHPNLAAAHFILGKFYFTQQSMKRAGEEFDQTVSLDPRNARAYLYLAGAAQSLNQMDRAWQAASRAVALEPGSKEAQLIYASISARTRKPVDQVGTAYREALRLDPRNAVAHQEYAAWLLETARAPQDRDRAAQEAERAIALGSKDPAAFQTLGRARMYNDQPGAAVQPFLQAAEMAPEDPAPALALSQLFRALRQPLEAGLWQSRYLQRQNTMSEKSRLLQAVTVAPDDPAPKLRLARWLGHHGDADGCVHHYSMAMHKPLDAAPVLTAAAHDLVTGGHGDLAVPLARRAVLGAAHSPDAHEALGEALLYDRQPKAAAEEYNTAIRLDPTRADRLIGKLKQYVASHKDEPGLQGASVEVHGANPLDQ